MKRILFTGPESTGKTEMAKVMARVYKSLWVPEFAREYFQHNGQDYQYEDLLAIAKGQLKQEEQIALEANDFLFCDTSMLVMKVWSEFKFDQCDPWILRKLTEHQYDLYILCGTDIPWTFDPLRENPNEREELYQIYKQELIKMNVPFRELTGNMQERIQKCQTWVEALESQSNVKEFPINLD